jgi:hypothetical protein
MEVINREVVYSV